MDEGGQRRSPRMSFLSLVGRGNLKPVGIYLFFLVNNFLVNLLGIPVGMLRGLDSDGRCLFENRPQKRIRAESIKQMVALLIVAPVLAGTGAPSKRYRQRLLCWLSRLSKYCAVSLSVQYR